MRKQAKNRAEDKGKFNCITNLEETGLDAVINQYEAQTGIKVEICKKCKPVVAELFLFFFLKLMEDLNPELFKELNKDDD